MGRVWVWAVALCASGAVAAQENNLGPSYIGMCSSSWPCEQSLKVFDGLPVKRLGYLAVTFGEKCPCVTKFLGLPGKKYVRVHLANGTCFPERGRHCEKGEPFFGESILSAEEKLKARNPGLLRRYRRNIQFVKRNLTASDNNTTVRYSLALESPFIDRARKTLRRVARKELPANSVFVDSVLGQHCLKGTICERHGISGPGLAPQCIGDTDGEAVTDDVLTSFLERSGQCEAGFLWVPSFNLLDAGSPVYRKPKERTAASTHEDFDQLAGWLRVGASW